VAQDDQTGRRHYKRPNVIAPTTVTADLIDKRADYARFGIPHY
jgi:hypothetical protein